jgi:hypothetical protein
MNFTSEHRTLIYGAAAGVLVVLLILLVALRTKSKKRKSGTNAGSTTSQQHERTAPAFEHSLGASPTSHTEAESDARSDNDAAAHTDASSYFSQDSEPVSSAPEFIELFVVEDPLDGSGYLGTQINRQTSYISDFEIRALINRYEDQLLSEETLRSGFAEKSTVAGKIRTVLFGEVEAISKSTAAFHPEISDRILKATNDSADFRLLAIDGLVYGVFVIKL